MAPSTAKKFIDAALYSIGPHALSYTHHDNNRIIRDHLLSLLADFPSLSPSTDRYVHNDGTSVHLLNVSGCLPVSANPHPIHLTIWVHQFYPFAPPLVFLTTSPTYSILRGHPFVDTSGAASSPYLQIWQYPRSNLSDLTRNLVHIFTHHPPFSDFSSTSYHSRPSLPSKREAIDRLVGIPHHPPFSDFSSTSYHSRPSLPSKREAIDRLVGILYYDLTSLRTQVENETEDLLSLQVTLKKRTQTTVTMIKELEEEKSSLKERIKQVVEKVDVLQIWSKENGCGLTSSLTQDVCEKFEAEDEKSRQILENEAAERAIEDAIEVLDKEAQNGSVSCGAYIRQIRTLAREQFFHRAMRVKLHNSVLYPQ